MENITKSARLLFFSLCIFSIIFLGSLGYFLYLSSYPTKTLVVLNEPVPVDSLGLDNKTYLPTKTIRPGQSLYLDIHYIKYLHSESSVCVQFSNQLTYSTPLMYSNFPYGKNRIKYRVEIPDQLPPGLYSIKLLITYHINSFRTVTKTIESETFYVEPNK